MVTCLLIPIILEALLPTLAIVGMNCPMNLLSEHVLLEPGLDRISLVKVSKRSPLKLMLTEVLE